MHGRREEESVCSREEQGRKCCPRSARLCMGYCVLNMSNYGGCPLHMCGHIGDKIRFLCSVCGLSVAISQQFK